VRPNAFRHDDVTFHGRRNTGRPRERGGVSRWRLIARRDLPPTWVASPPPPRTSRACFQRWLSGRCVRRLPLDAYLKSAHPRRRGVPDFRISCVVVHGLLADGALPGSRELAASRVRLARDNHIRVPQLVAVRASLGR
jgi:hypothetical protein